MAEMKVIWRRDRRRLEEEAPHVGRKRKGRRRQHQKSTTPSKPLTPELREEIHGWAEEAAEVHGLYVWDVEFLVQGRWIVRVYVDRPGAEPGEGINVSQCAEISRYLEALFDADERVPEVYVLEVSSPGIERPLKNAAHLQRVVDHDVELVLREPVKGKNKVVGRLVSHDDGVLTVEIDEEIFEIDWDDVARAKLKFDFSKESKNR